MAEHSVIVSECENCSALPPQKRHRKDRPAAYLGNFEKIVNMWNGFVFMFVRVVMFADEFDYCYSSSCS